MIRRLRGERGFALPTTMLIIFAAFATVSVGVASTISVQRGTVRDQGTKAAVQLAQTGVNQALYQYNKIPPSDVNPCSPVTTSGPGSNGWCPPVGPFSEPGGGTFTYQVHPFNDLASNGDPNKKVIEIVGTGRFGSATRRVFTRAESPQQNFFSDASVKTANGVIIDSNATVHAITATNGDITVDSNARQCGPATVGIGRQLVLVGGTGYFSDTGCTTPTSTVSQQELVLPSVNQGDAPINNDNSRFFSQDKISGNKNNACFNGLDGTNHSSANCGARELFLGSNSAVTLTGHTYSFCKLTMTQNSALYVEAGETVAIYFDSPEHCYPNSTGAITQMQLDSNTRITSTSGTPSNLGLLFVGSTDLNRQSTILLSSNTAAGTTCQQNYVVYAPLSHIELNSNSTYCGALGSRTLHLDSNADLKPPSNLVDFKLPPLKPHYGSKKFTECNVATGATPSVGC